MICGNKCDLEHAREVPTQEGLLYAESIGWPFFETSAKLDINVTEAIHELIRRTPRRRGKEYRVRDECVCGARHGPLIVYCVCSSMSNVCVRACAYVCTHAILWSLH